MISSEGADSMFAARARSHNTDERLKLRLGERLTAKYEPIETLGEGGIGIVIVIAARHIDIDRQVALKFLRASTLVRHLFVTLPEHLA